MTRDEESVIVAQMAATLAASAARATVAHEEIATEAWALLDAVKKATPPAEPSKYRVPTQ
jgi:hypothetical protein